MSGLSAFPLDTFLARFPEFDDSEKYPVANIQNCGDRAMMYITPSVPGMPMVGPHREYALFLATAHMITLGEQSEDDSGISLGGMPYKATVGSVTVETTKQNTFTLDDWALWFGKTRYGQELLAYLDTQCPLGIFVNTPCDSVRDLI